MFYVFYFVFLYCRRLHEVWKGNEVFLCGGRIMMGPSRWNVIMSLLLIVAPGGHLLTFFVPYNIVSASFYSLQTRLSKECH